MNKVLVAVLFALSIIGCRSVPFDVHQAHEQSMTESDAMFDIVEPLLSKVESGVNDLDSTEVRAKYDVWIEHLNELALARNFVLKYLKDTKAGEDLTGPYILANDIMRDMNAGMDMLTFYWEQFFDEQDQGEEEFVALFRRDIERFKILERKFDEWISQFRVKGE